MHVLWEHRLVSLYSSAILLGKHLLHHSCPYGWFVPTPPWLVPWSLGFHGKLEIKRAGWICICLKQALLCQRLSPPTRLFVQLLPSNPSPTSDGTGIAHQWRGDRGYWRCQHLIGNASITDGVAPLQKAWAHKHALVRLLTRTGVWRMILKVVSTFVKLSLIPWQ